jgi:alpha-galactosidase
MVACVRGPRIVNKLLMGRGRRRSAWLFVLCLLAHAGCATAQEVARIATADTIVELQAGAHAPLVVRLLGADRAEWKNQESERLISFAEIGEDRIPLQASLSFDWLVEREESLEHFYVEKGGDRPTEEGTHRVNMSATYEWEGNSSTYAASSGTGTREIIPWMMVEKSTPGEEGWYAGIEFSGRTQLRLQRTKNSLRGELGLNPRPGVTRTRLAAGEIFEAPVVFLCAISGGPDAAANSLHKWEWQVLVRPETRDDPKYPLLVNNSWGSGTEVDEALALEMIRAAADFQLEMFHLDAGWFRAVGDWAPDAKKFPRGLGSVAAEAHRRGLRFGLWLDWAQAGDSAAPGALRARDENVRDWLLQDVPTNWRPEAFKGQTIDVGVPAAAKWAETQAERVVNDFQLDMLEHDGYLVAQGCSRADHPHAPPDSAGVKIHWEDSSPILAGNNSTDVSYRATKAYYAIQEKLRKEHPGLLLEICNDGGRMIDFGSAAHGDYFSMTDSYDPVSNRRAFFDASYVLPPAMLEAYVEKWPAPKLENFRYMLRSGMMGWFTAMLDTRIWTPEQRDAAREEFRVYREELRPLIRTAELYDISPRPDGENWDAMEYFDPERGRGVVYVFRGIAENKSQHGFRLKGLRHERTYQVRFHDHSETDRTISGQSLMVEGPQLSLAETNSSELIFLTEIPVTGR